MSNRVIKFRAWDMVNNRMYYHYDFPDQYLIGIDGAVWDTKAPDSFGLGLGNTVDCFILMQFTGLHDKEGKEIYENDVVQDDEATYRIFWNADCCCFDALRLEDGSNMMGFGCYTHDIIADIIQSSKYIGNIYQKPELLK